MFHLALLAAMAAAPPEEPDFARLPIDREVTKGADLYVPIGDSVRAATWDELSIKPSAPVRVRLACIVFAPNGAPGRCVPAERVAGTADRVDWTTANDGYSRERATEDPRTAALHDIAERRIGQLRLIPDRANKAMFVVRLFDETIAPDDRRPPFQSAAAALRIGDVTLRKPIDGALLQALYPVAALRAGIAARVALQCAIQPSLTLLCRDKGEIQMQPGGPGTTAASVAESFRLATYQVLSSLKLAETSTGGEPVVGRNLRIAVNWRLPGD